MVVNCETVWHEISNYVDGEVAADERATMDQHFSECKKCTAVLEGTRNVVLLYGDERMVEVPLGFGHRLHRRLDESLYPTRRGFFGWMVAAAAGMLVVSGFEAARSLSPGNLDLRSPHSQPGKGVPAEMSVLVYPDGKTFHRQGCEFILDKKNLRTVTAAEAEREGYTPCVRCMKQYVS
jgi:Putative zinc-finger